MNWKSVLGVGSSPQRAIGVNGQTYVISDEEWHRIMRTVTGIHGGSGSQTTYVKPPKVIDPIEAATDDVLILELISRGYAVAKMRPEELAEEL